MKIFATFNEDGRATGFYPDDIYEPIATDPYVRNAAISEDAVEVTDEQRNAIVGAPDKWMRVDGVIADQGDPPAPVPQTISDRQFFQQLAIVGLCTEAEALAAVQTGTLPAAILALIAGITDPDELFAAKMLLTGATIFQRNHALTNSIGAGAGMTSEQVDAFFTAAALL